MSKYDGGSAFPQLKYEEILSPLGKDRFPIFSGGMTLRDWFAGMALSGWYTNHGELPHRDYLELYAANFYLIADAMLAEREREK